MDVARPWKEQSPKPLVAAPELGGRFYAWSWSSDGRKLAGDLRNEGDASSGIGIYSLDTERLERLTDYGTRPVWLGDNRRLLFTRQGQLHGLDSHSGKSREVLSVAPGTMGGVTLSPDARVMYFSVNVAEADIWLATLN